MPSDHFKCEHYDDSSWCDILEAYIWDVDKFGTCLKFKSRTKVIKNG